MRITMLLADAAQVVAGKLYILGGGWSVMGPAPARMTIALRFEVPWDERGREHGWVLELVDGDGRAVMCADHGTHPVRFSGRFTASPQAGAPPGGAIDLPFAIDAGVVAVAPGRYVWVLTVDGETREDWQLALTCRGTMTEP